MKFTDCGNQNWGAQCSEFKTFKIRLTEIWRSSVSSLSEQHIVFPRFRFYEFFKMRSLWDADLLAIWTSDSGM